MAEYRLKYRSAPESEGAMENDVAELLAGNGVEEEVVHRIMLAISEAFTNALVHGNKIQADKWIEMRLEINDWVVSADITDQGRGGLGRIEHRRPPELLGEHGRGIDLIRHYCDTVSFTELSTGGLQVALSIKRARKQVSEQI